jgi:hypothetical protein
VGIDCQSERHIGIRIGVTEPKILSKWDFSQADLLKLTIPLAQLNKYRPRSKGLNPATAQSLLNHVPQHPGQAPQLIRDPGKPSRSALCHTNGQKAEVLTIKITYGQ